MLSHPGKTLARQKDQAITPIEADAGGSGVTVNTSTASLLLTENTASVSVGVTVNTTTEALTLTQNTASVLVNTDIPAIILDGFGDFRAFTTAPTGAAAGTQFAGAHAREFQSDGSAMTIAELSNGTGVVLSLRRTATNTIELKGFQSDASTAVFSNTTAAIPASTGRVLILWDCSGTTANLYVITIDDATLVTGTNTPGSAGNIDPTGTWYFGRTAAGDEYEDSIVNYDTIAAEFPGFTDSDKREEFYDSTNFEIRNPGSDGSNPWAAQPLVSFQNHAGNFLVNAGSGGDADTGSNSGDGTSPGQYADDYANDPGLTVMQAAFTRWVNSDASNTITSGAVETWNDIGTEGLVDVTQGTAGFRPTDNTTYADFDGTDDELSATISATSLFSVFNSGGTFAIVLNIDAAGTDTNIWDLGLGERLRISNESGGACDLELQFRMQLASGNYSVAATLSVGAVAILFVRHNKGTGSTALKVNIDSSTALTTSAGITVNTAPSGALRDTATTLIMGGPSNINARMYEVAWWDSVLSDADVDDAGTYLASTYSGTWT